MLAIIDYGMGNLRSVEKALESLGYKTKITRDFNDIKNSEGIILPGVGAFPKAMENLKAKNLDIILKEEVYKGKPLLGICLGMQLLFNSSEEITFTEGLGLIEGTVKKFEVKEKIPHMGWNNLKFNVKSPILNGIKEDSYVYFVHSFYANLKDENLNAYTEYGTKVPAVVSSGKVIGFQFHPEKSSDVGLKMLSNFKELL